MERELLPRKKKREGFATLRSEFTKKKVGEPTILESINWNLCSNWHL